MSSTNLSKLKEKRKENREQRRQFVKYWAHYIRKHPDKDWSRQQNKIIDSQLTKQNRDQEKKDQTD